MGSFATLIDPVTSCNQNQVPFWAKAKHVNDAISRSCAIYGYVRETIKVQLKK
jgi:hypothetical protein